MAKPEEAEELFKDFSQDQEEKKRKKSKRINIVETRTLERSGSEREQTKELVVRYKPVIIERFIFLAIIAILVGVLLYKSFSACPFSSLFEREVPVFVEETQGNQSESKESVKIEAKGPADQNTTAVKKESPKPKGDGPITINIDRVNYGKDDNDKPLKIESIEYTIDNQKSDLAPTVKVYWYDKDSEVLIKNKVRTSFSFIVPIRKGERISGKLRTFDSFYFDKANPEEIIKLELVDQADDEILAIKTVTIK